jgi:hypothetical protein
MEYIAFLAYIVWHHQLVSTWNTSHFYTIHHTPCSYISHTHDFIHFQAVNGAAAAAGGGVGAGAGAGEGSAFTASPVSLCVFLGCGERVCEVCGVSVV